MTITFSDLQLMINTYRKAQNQPVRKVPEEIKNLEDIIQKTQSRKDQAIKDGKTRQEIIEIDNTLQQTKRRLRNEIQKYQRR